MPAGNSDGGQWTDAGGGGSGGRVLSDAQPDDFWTPGAELAQADGDATAYPINLLEEEELGGHTVARHVGKSEEYLRARVLNNRINIAGILGLGEKRAGSFRSVEAANKLVNSTLSDPANKSEIEAFVRRDFLSSLPVMYLFKTFKKPTGYEVYLPAGKVVPRTQPTYGVTVRLARSTKRKNGFYVVSAWPMNED